MRKCLLRERARPLCSCIEKAAYVCNHKIIPFPKSAVLWPLPSAHALEDYTGFQQAQTVGRPEYAVFIIQLMKEVFFLFSGNISMRFFFKKTKKKNVLAVEHVRSAALRFSQGKMTPPPSVHPPPPLCSPWPKNLDRAEITGKQLFLFL